VPTLTSHNGTALSWRVMGEPAAPVVCLPGGPLQSTRYLGNLGGLDATRQLLLLELPSRRVDLIVEDLEALRAFLDLKRLDVVAHSAGAALAMLFAVAYPDRVRRLALITPTTRPVGIDLAPGEWRAPLERRSGEPWYAAAMTAIEAMQLGDNSLANQRAAAPAFYGRWDHAAQRHAAAEPDEPRADNAAIYYAAGAFEPALVRAGLRRVTADVLVLVGEMDVYPNLRVATELAELFPRSTVVCQETSAHYPWLDNPAVFRNTLTHFLGRG
jgi:pimeloyl-ACP methyl ester carboxylesterase